MIDISQKSNTLRIATAQAIVKVSKQETIDAINSKTVPKGNVLEMAKTAGLFAVKKTADMIPDCHPIPVEHTQISYKIDNLNIIIEIHAKTIYKTGIEVEVMHGASVIALTIYDMLKPIDKGIEIMNIKLLDKKGGKSDFMMQFKNPLTAAIIVCSDSIHAGDKEDKAGQAIVNKLNSLDILTDEFVIIPDNQDLIRQKVKGFCDLKLNMVIITGGTGLSPRDNTPQAISTLIDKEIPGIMEAARAYGQSRTPYSMLSRSIAGMRKNTLILSMPGSTKGAKETMDALFPAVLHIFRVQDAGYKH